MPAFTGSSWSVAVIFPYGSSLLDPQYSGTWFKYVAEESFATTKQHADVYFFEGTHKKETKRKPPMSTQLCTLSLRLTCWAELVLKPCRASVAVLASSKKPEGTCLPTSNQEPDKEEKYHVANWTLHQTDQETGSNLTVSCYGKAC